MQKQFIKITLYMSVILLAIQTTSVSVFAQSSPSLSPWLGLLDRSRSASGLDNYNRLVRPQQNMMKSYANQARQLQLQQRALQAMQNPNLGPLNASMGNPQETRELLNAASSGISDGRGKNMLLNAPREIPSSTNPATYHQYLHYYPPGGMMQKPVPNFSRVGGRR